MRTFVITRNGVARVMRTYALGPGGRVISPDIEGSVEEVTPAPNASDEISRWPKDLKAEVSAVREISEADIPSEVRLRDAWRDDGTAITTDMPVAREVQMNHIRRERDKALAESDKTMMRAMEGGDDAETARLKAERQALRDIPQTFDLTSARNPAELQNLWPTGLRKP